MWISEAQAELSSCFSWVSFCKEGKVNSFSKSRHWGDRSEGRKCNGLCSLFICKILWVVSVPLASVLSCWHRAEKGRPRAILLSVDSAMTSNCKTWTQCPSWVSLSKLGLSAKAVIPSTRVFPLANELWGNRLVILSTSALATRRRLLPSRWVLKLVGLNQKTPVLSQKQKRKSLTHPSNKTKTKSEN